MGLHTAHGSGSGSSVTRPYTHLVNVADGPTGGWHAPVTPGAARPRVAALTLALQEPPLPTMQDGDGGRSGVRRGESNCPSPHHIVHTGGPEADDANRWVSCCAAGRRYPAHKRAYAV